MGRLYCWVLACNAFVEILFEMTRNFVTGSLLVSYVIIPANLAKRGLRNRENISMFVGAILRSINQWSC